MKTRTALIDASTARPLMLPPRATVPINEPTIKQHGDDRIRDLVK